MVGLKVKPKDLLLQTHHNYLQIIFALIAILAFCLSFYNIYHVFNRPNDECSWEDSQNVVKIITVQKGGASDKAGMIPGDILLKIAGENATSSSRAQAVLDNQKVGTTVTYFVLRETRFLELNIEIVPFGLPTFNLIMTFIGFIFGLVGFWIVWIRSAA